MKIITIAAMAAALSTTGIAQANIPTKASTAGEKSGAAFCHMTMSAPDVVSLACAGDEQFEQALALAMQSMNPADVRAEIGDGLKTRAPGFPRYVTAERQTFVPLHPLGMMGLSQAGGLAPRAGLIDPSTRKANTAQRVQEVESELALAASRQGVVADFVGVAVPVPPRKLQSAPLNASLDNQPPRQVDPRAATQPRYYLYDHASGTANEVSQADYERATASRSSGELQAHGHTSAQDVRARAAAPGALSRVFDTYNGSGHRPIYVAANDAASQQRLKAMGAMQFNASLSDGRREVLYGPFRDGPMSVVALRDSGLNVVPYDARSISGMQRGN